jgi:hypothetical protein
LTYQSGNCVDSVPDHLKDALDSCRENLNPDQLNKVCNLLKEFSTVTKDDLGETDCVFHKADTGHARPIKQAPRRVPLSQKNEVSQELKRMLDVGVINPQIYHGLLLLC